MYVLVFPSLEIIGLDLIFVFSHAMSLIVGKLCLAT